MRKSRCEALDARISAVFLLVNMLSINGLRLKMSPMGLIVLAEMTRWRFRNRYFVLGAELSRKEDAHLCIVKAQSQMKDARV